MRITNNYTNTYSPKFGMSFIATDNAIKYMNSNLKPEKIKTVNEMIASQSGKKPNIHLHLGIFKSECSGKEVPYLRARVNDEVFEEGLFTSAFGVIKKATKYAEKLQKKS